MDGVKVDGKLDAWQPAGVIEAARQREELGYDGLWASESAHDPFLPLVLAAEHTRRLELGTAIAVAFARSPMQLAYAAHDLQVHAGGRFMLGLGSQVKAHVERRFSMPWSRPAARMREYVCALRAIWASWNDGARLDFRGDFYSHTLMAPFFSPPPAPGGAPEVLIAAVGPAMTRVAGEVADGMFAHAFTTERYLREVTVPTLQQGLAAAGRDRSRFTLSHLLLAATGSTQEELATATQGIRRQIAFYASTPAYQGVLELHGWQALGEELVALSRSDRADKWDAMVPLVDDEVLDAFAVVGEPDRIGPQILKRFGGVVDRLSFYTAIPVPAQAWAPVIDLLHRG